MNFITDNLQSKITTVLKIFFMGMVRQFLAHTILTYGLKIPSFFSFIWVWKELIIAGIGGILLRFFLKYKEYRIQLLNNTSFMIIIISILLSLGISLITSLGIHHQWITTFIASAKFNHIPLIIFIVGAWASYLLTKEQLQSLFSTILTTIKRVLIFSLFRYGILHTIPNILDWIWFSQPGMSIEWTADTPPPSLWLTEFYTGYVRNQWPFGWPLSLGFYLVALRPFFYAFQLYKRKFSDVWGRWLLYIGIVLSTYSRAARGIFLISSVFLLLIIYRKYTKYIITLGFITCIAIGLYIVWWWTSELFLRTWSDKGHIEYFFQWLNLVKENWLRWLGAASVWPGSNHIGGIEKVFNPENQYMQIWLEYGLIGVISWILSYITILVSPMKERFILWISKIKKDINKETLAYIGIGISIIALSAAGMVLHPFVDSSSIYPFMLMSGLIYGYYHQYTKYEKLEEKKLTKKEKKLLYKQLHTTHTDSSITQQFNNNNSKDGSTIHLYKSVIRSTQYSNLLISHTKQWTTKSPIHQLTHLVKYLPYIRTILISIFFIIQTYLTFWIKIIDNTVLMSSIRDIIFALSIGITLIQGRSSILTFIKKYRFIILPILIIVVINIYYILTHDWNLFSMIAGVKYDIFQFIIIGWGLRLGYFFFQNNKQEAIYKYMRRFLWLSLILIIIGALWQIGKNIVPEVFVQYLGYSNPSDFIPYTKPPIYYITGAGGIERLSWLFVWPNTLWFFLILMTSVLYFYIKDRYSKKVLTISTIIYLLISMFTLSRSTIVWITFQIILLLWYETFILWQQTFTESSRILFKKKWPYLLIIGISSILVFLTINIWKNDSNNERAVSGSTINEIIKESLPLFWYGPGNVGPARHYTTDYQENKKNDHAMLENIYLQTLINQWWLWLAMFMSIFGGIFFLHSTFRKYKPRDDQSQYLITIIQYMWIWLLWLLSVGRFLHIFIDSMVTYLFFLPYSIVLWYNYALVSSLEHTFTK